MPINLMSIKPAREAIAIATIENAAIGTFGKQKGMAVAREVVAYLRRNNDWHEKEYGIRPEMADYMGDFQRYPVETIKRYLADVDDERREQGRPGVLEEYTASRKAMAAQRKKIKALVDEALALR